MKLRGHIYIKDKDTTV